MHQEIPLKKYRKCCVQSVYSRQHIRLHLRCKITPITNAQDTAVFRLKCCRPYVSRLGCMLRIISIQLTYSFTPQHLFCNVKCVNHLCPGLGWSVLPRDYSSFDFLYSTTKIAIAFCCYIILFSKKRHGAM